MVSVLVEILDNLFEALANLFFLFFRFSSDVSHLVSEPESRKALVAALGSGRVILVDGDRVIAA